MGKKKNQSVLGKSIIKDRFKASNQRRNTDESWLHTSDLNDGYEWGRLNLNSVTDQSHLDDFLLTAELAGTEFTAERQNIRVVDPNDPGLPSAEETKAIKEAQELNRDLLCIPRRPKWDASMTKEELVQRERDSFLEWRRRLAKLQEKEHVVLTPFERNLEFWRQLWRVIERSDIIVQIVDARNPLLFRCEDLEKYVKEIGSSKENMVLISKADLLSPQQRQQWADYFSQLGLRVALWSAVLETERFRQEAAEQSSGTEDSKDKQYSDSDQDNVEDDNLVPSQHASVLRDEMPDDEEDTTKDDSKDSNSQQTTTQQLGLDTTQPVQPNDQQAAASETPSHPETNRGPTEEGASSTSCISEERTGTLCDNRSSETQNSRTFLNTSGQSGFEPSTSNQRQCADSASSTSEQVAGHHSEDALQDDEEISNSREETGCGSGDGRGPKDGCGSEDEDGRGRADKKGIGQVVNSSKLLTGEELIQFFYSLHEGPKVQEGITTVGMVGYPNVGKSSTINALLQRKKVPVSATPGRTKHFQTLFVEPTMCLCDCPGLVMPSMVSSKAEMTVSGILCIDHLRDYIPPVSLLCQRIPRHILNSIYGINIIRPREGEDMNRVPTAREFLSAYAYMRGFMTNHGIPDCPRAARVVLKDYVKGKLLFCHPPPGVDAVEFQAFSKPDPRGADSDSTKTKREATGPVITDEGTKLKKQPTSSKLDEAFFAQKTMSSHTKGAIGPRGALSSMPGQGSSQQQQQQQLSASQQRLIDKPWKKHGNRNKREKLRRVYAHHDE